MKSEELVKLVRTDGTTRNGMTWPIGAVRKARGKRGQGLCSNEYLHAYRTPLQAEFMRHAHGQFSEPLIVRGVVHADDGTKIGCRQLTVLRCANPLPHISATCRAAIAIIIAPHKSTREWALGWLSGRNRSAANVVAYAAYAANAAVNAVNAAAYAAIPLQRVIDDVLAIPDGPWDHLYGEGKS